MDNKQIAAKVFKAVKDILTEARRKNKEKGCTDAGSRARKSQQADITIEEAVSWKNGTPTVKHYSVKVGNKVVAKVGDTGDIAGIFSELRDLLDAQKEVRGWAGLNYITERVEVECLRYPNPKVTAVPKVCLADAPCPEYVSLMNYVNKFGKTRYAGAVDLRPLTLFSAAMGGKRGYLWDEYGERIFLDNRPKRCAKFLDELRKARGSKDTMTCEVKEENYIDPLEQEYTAREELECSGEKRKYLKVVITSPTGRVKLDTKIF